MNIRMTRLAGGKALRSMSVDGRLHNVSWNRGLVLLARPLAEDRGYDSRLVTTSPLVEVTYLADGCGIVVDTMTGSRYLLERVE